MSHSYDGLERRTSLRFLKNYNLFFYFKDTPDKKSDATFIKDIGKGGIRFTTAQLINEGTHLIFEISISYIAPKRLILEGVVLSSKEIITPSLVYEVRAKFNPLDKETIQLFDLIEKRNLKGL
jgi:hypothetical protein